MRKVLVPRHGEDRNIIDKKLIERLRFFIMMSELESTGGCISQFSSFVDCWYSTSLIFFNMLDVRGLSIGFQLGFQTVHVCFVFIFGILLYNLMIALFSDEVNIVSDNREVILSIDQFWTV